MDLSSMANSWVDSYLDALLTTGLSSEFARKASEEKEASQQDADSNVAAKYYVQQILAQDEHSLKDAWLKVSHRPSTAGVTAERDARLQYLSWRVWGMKRKHALVSESLAAEAETEDTEGSDVSPSDHAAHAEADDLFTTVPTALPTLNLPKRTISVESPSEASEEHNLLSPELPSSPQHGTEQLQLTADRVPKLYCVLISMHGLVRGDRMELGKDPDTGGQVKYAVELAKSLSRHPAVHRVDLLTRMIKDPKVDASYGEPLEVITEPDGNMGGAYIVRIPCGPVQQYIRKEYLWPYIREFADNALNHVHRTMGKLMTVGEPCELYYVHGHYADAGEAAALMSYTLGVDMVLTGHSLGRNKLDHLLKSGTMSRKEIEASYAISRRIEGEERALDAAVMVFTSTLQEVKDQWGLYDGYDPALERVVRLRHRKGRHFPIMNVVPPGLDFSALNIVMPVDPYEALNATKGRISTASGLEDDRSPLGDQNTGTMTHSRSRESLGTLTHSRSRESFSGNNPMSPRSPNTAGPRHFEDPPIWQDIFRFLRNPRKPVILAMSRPDAKKNITTLVKAYGENRHLREIANLVLIMGNRTVIDNMAGGSQRVMEQVLKLIDAYNLYGSVAYPKTHTQKDISDIYSLPRETRGVFVNIALQEPFGLTLIEAAAMGVPIIATTNGGPVDIVKTLSNGILVEPTDYKAVGDAILKVLTDSQMWDEYSSSGVNNIHAYSWPSHCVKCLEATESEKVRATHVKKHMIKSTFSGAMDDFALLLSPSAAAASAAAHSHASFSAGSPRHAGTASEGTFGATDDSGLESSGGDYTPKAAAAEGWGRRSLEGDRPLSATSMPLGDSSTGAAMAGLQGMKERYVVFVLDSADTVKCLSKLLVGKGKGTALMGLVGNRGVGLGLMSVYSLADTAAILKDGGLSLSDMDFAITHSGAEIWYLSGEENQLDEGYDALVDNKWDKVSVRRLLSQCLNQKNFLAPAATKGSSTQAVAAGGAGMAVTLAAAAGGTSQSLPRPKVTVNSETGTYHLLINLSPADPQQQKQGLVMTPTDQVALVGRIKRRFRRSGVRCQLMAQLEEGSSHIHVTPLRASRTLALRYLTYKHRVDLRNIALVCCPRDLEMGEGGKLGMATFAASDLEDVVAGVQKVLLVPPEMQQHQEVGDVHKPGFSVDLGVFGHDNRVQVLMKGAPGTV